MSLILPSNCDDTVLLIAADMEAPFSADPHSNVNYKPSDDLTTGCMLADDVLADRVRRELFKIVQANGQEGRFLVYRYLHLAIGEKLRTLAWEFNHPAPDTDSGEGPTDPFWRDEERVQNAHMRLRAILPRVQSIGGLLPPAESINDHDLGWEYQQSLLCLLFERADSLAARIDSSPDGRRLFAYDLWRVSRNLFEESLDKRLGPLGSSRFGDVAYSFPLVSWPESSPQYEAAERACKILATNEGDSTISRRLTSAILVDLCVTLGRLSRAASVLENTEVSMLGLRIAGWGPAIIEGFGVTDKQAAAFVESVFDGSQRDSLQLAGKIWMQIEEYEKVLSVTQRVLDRGRISSEIHDLRFKAYERLAKHQEAATEFVKAADLDPAYAQSPEKTTLVALGRLAKESPEHFKPICEHIEKLASFETQEATISEVLHSHWTRSAVVLRALGEGIEKDWMTACVYLFGGPRLPEADRADLAILKLSRCIEQVLRWCLHRRPEEKVDTIELVEGFEALMEQCGLPSTEPRKYMDDVRGIRNVSTHHRSVTLQQARDVHRYAIGVIREVGLLLEKLKKKTLPSGKRM